MQPRFTPNVRPSVTKLISHLCNEHQMQFSINSLQWSLHEMENSSRTISKTTYNPDSGHPEITANTFSDTEKNNKLQ